MRHVSVLFSVLAICAVLLLGGGCSSKQKEVITTKTEISTTHEHKIGPHGGLVAGVGLNDKLHVELVNEKEYTWFYILDEDEKTPVDITNQLMQVVFIQERICVEALPVVAGTNIKLNVLQDRAKDNLFVSVSPNFLFTQAMLRLKVDNDSYTVTWDLMPIAKPTGEEAEICLKPGGIYTLEDIKANGNIVPSAKYKGFVANHVNPNKGDWICPITGSRGDERCWWIINGQKYYACCPPCLVNMVQMAKSNTGQLKSAKEYVKRD